MPAQPVTPAEPEHPMHALTSYELRNYRRELEHAVKGISPEAPVQAELRSKLAEVLAEQEQRAKLVSNG